MTALLVLMVAGFLLGLATGHFAAVAVTAMSVVAYYVGLVSGWWGNGTGEFWAGAMVSMIAIASVVAIVGVLLGRTWRRR